MDPRRLLPVLAATTAVVVLVTLATLAWRTWSPSGDRAPAPAIDVHGASPSPGSGPSAAAVLAGWDERRARAWAAGDVEGLRRLYAADSPVARSDVALLRSYVGRGLRVVGLQTQVLDLEVVSARPGRLHVVVTDRVVGGEAVGRRRTVDLPRDLASTRRVVLVRVGGTWVVQHAQDVPVQEDQPSAAASTSRTSRSWKS